MKVLNNSKRWANWILLSTSLYPVVVSSQPTAVIGGTQSRHWSVYFQVAGALNGPANDIEQAMKTADFDKRSSGSFFGPGADHPFSTADKISWTLGVSRLIRPSFTIGLLVSRTIFGTTSGYHEEAGLLFVDYSATTVTPTLAVHANESLRIGLGPAFYFARAWNSNDAVQSSSDESVFKIGLLLDLGLRLPKRSRFFGDLSLQYRKIGNVAIGPFTAASLGRTATVPATSVNFDHFLIAAGIGLRH